MKKPGLGAAIFFSIVLPAVFGQSGRRVQPTPTPAVSSVIAAPVYSESVPAPTRRPTEDRFPGVSLPKPKPATDKAPPTATALPASDDDVVKVETNLVTIPVSVFDRSGLYIPNLKRENFTIFEDGREQEIAYFGTDDKPFTVVLLIDTSLSTEYKIEEIQAAATAFVDQLKPNDRVMVVEFDGNVHILSEVTSVREQIYKGIRKADFGYGTSLYDAVNFSLKKHLNQISGRKAIVLFTDGVDTTSRKSTYDTTLDLAEESDSLIFPIYYNTFGSNPARNRNWGGPPDPGTTAEEYAIGRKYLDELALYTGGRVFKPESTPGGLTRAFEGIADELRRQYNIGYIPAEESIVGQRKKIKVRVDQPNLVVRSRDSYTVGSAVQTSEPRATPSKK